MRGRACPELSEGQTGGPADRRTIFNLFTKLTDTLRRIAGMPDYDAHLEHLRRCHPEVRPPTRRKFYDDFIRARYGDGPTRCC
jgi:uncharacterized short protein YbdD (DUF466 family)